MVLVDGENDDESSNCVHHICRQSQLESNNEMIPTMGRLVQQ
jgi:hypothetical protein